MKRILRVAELKDFDAVSKLDKEIIGPKIDRSEEICKAISESRCKVVEVNSVIEGFSIAASKAFREMDLLNLVVVRPTSRRQGIATILINHFRDTSATPECWTSTNMSNEAMMSLLRKLGWHESDQVEELDLGDPECFFFWRR